ncbi:hypothetical protein SAMD00019534_058590 [Acytostelium subglobosum LB1]|uniref:hypothetical protein n=1 Tax=Acytostelium subglobosum LB1 TaxID=1410327 RepID=UPI000644F19F|nr:hypothetical protein SAMD00019534_058590 [Acytostelium subglobosum LB1]GAM22684.1 hypothetical protein SAMD00019534_058590 [Acytostelium subglobosum LB1]|eukprot:XP_012754804.1 hypothetical protein SAMD00019534_058590 [Acytostelium subglobosum LB1]
MSFLLDQLNIHSVDDVVQTIQNFRWEAGVTPFSSIWSPIIGSLGYLVVIYLLQVYMKNRKEVKLHYICLAHNLFLSLLSLVMLLGVMVPLFITEIPQGLYHMVCAPKTDGTVSFFYYIFYLSKVYEFLDTIFLVLRKKKLIFLHVYHHFITFWLCWVNLVENTGVQWGDISANCFVHIIMYYYYYQCEQGNNPWWKKYITRVQIIQFVFDMSLHGMWHYYVGTSTPCNGSLRGTLFSDFVIMSFLMLFLQFYFRSYKRPAASSAAAVASNKDQKKTQ